MIAIAVAVAAAVLVAVAVLIAVWVLIGRVPVSYERSRPY
jgi:hypothetical protein